MASSGELEVSPAFGAVGVEVLPPECEAKGVLALVEGGFCASPKIRRSGRKKPINSISGHLLKLRPLSPLMRMAEMRRNGLRSKSMKHSGMQGVEGFASFSSKGRKGSGRKGPKALLSIPEVEEVRARSVEVLEGKECVDEAAWAASGSLAKDRCALVPLDGLGGEGVFGVVKGLASDEMGVEKSENRLEISEIGLANEGFGVVPQKSGGEDDIEMVSMDASEVGEGNKGSPSLPAVESIVAVSEMDRVLDLSEAQPLQDMSFLEIKGNLEVRKGPERMETENVSAKWARLTEINLEEQLLGGKFLNGEFPPLNKDAFKNGKNKKVPPVVVQKGKDTQEGGEVQVEVSKETRPPVVHQNVKAGDPRGKNGAMYRQFADILKAGEKEPIFFEPEKIRKMGIVGESSGLPSIYFSGSDTAFLAEKLGHAVVGKFSHSIPSGHQIQNALQGMKLAGEFCWSYINAKHIMVQFKLLADYAKLLNGPNGRPVWFIDRHPMRIFKWTPDFDPFFESPIAPVWCNLVGLPIHLFERSALFAIGGLLGTPIQVDYSTISQKRLSFARICIEIDISKAPPEEIVIDIQGREIRQKVKWDKIPLYCDECKHVGHSRETCYANGNKEKPARRNYNIHYAKWQHPEEKVKVEKERQSVAEVEVAGPQPPLGALVVMKGMGEGAAIEAMEVQREEVGSAQEFGLEEAGFVSVGGKKGGSGGSRGRGQGRGLGRSFSFDRGRGGIGGGRGGYSSGRFDALIALSGEEVGESSGAMVQSSFSNPMFLKMLPNGDFEDEVYKDEKDWEPDDDQGESEDEESGRLQDKREADPSGLLNQSDDSLQKKGRFEPSGESMVS